MAGMNTLEIAAMLGQMGLDRPRHHNITPRQSRQRYDRSRSPARNATMLRRQREEATRHQFRPEARQDTPHPEFQPQPQPIQPAPPVPQAIPNAIYFNEGSGYLYVKTLGKGVDGSAILVRSVANGQLYVRKEEFLWNTLPNDPNFQTKMPLETSHARLARKIPGVYQARGWTRWVDRETSKFFDVTYWQYANLGCLHSFCDKARRMRDPVPEKWAALWAVSMIDTMIQVHKAGIVHNDPHGGNWLIQSTENGIPRIILGDFGRSERRERHSPTVYLSRCKSDFVCLLDNLCHNVGLIYDIRKHDVGRRLNNTMEWTLPKLLSQLAIASTRNWADINQLHKAVSRVSGQILVDYCKPSSQDKIPHPSAQPEVIDIAYATGPELMHTVRAQSQGFKQWRHATVWQKDISTQSTRSCKELKNQAGVWSDEEGESSPRWRVDRLRQGEESGEA